MTSSAPFSAPAPATTSTSPPTAADCSISGNTGLRCYYFAFAALAWFLHPLLVLVTTLLTMTMLIRRQFYFEVASNISAVLAEFEQVEQPEPDRLKQLM